METELGGNETEADFYENDCKYGECVKGRRTQSQLLYPDWNVCSEMIFR